MRRISKWPNKCYPVRPTTNSTKVVVVVGVPNEADGAVGKNERERETHGVLSRTCHGSRFVVAEGTRKPLYCYIIISFLVFLIIGYFVLSIFYFMCTFLVRHHALDRPHRFLHDP